MSHRPSLWLVVAAVSLGSVLAAPAQAEDQAAALACSKSLPPEAMTIYQDSAPYVSSDTDMRSLLRTRVKALIMAGSVQRATARGSAIAAYGCLRHLK